MSSSRLKTLVIIVLVLINMIFLVDIAGQRIVRAKGRDDALEALTAILASSGITLSDASITEINAPYAYATSQDAYGESAIARAILGDCAPEPAEAGQSQRYTGELGTAVFYTRGDFIIELTGDSIITGGSKRAVKKLLRGMGIDTDELVSTSLGGTEIITARCVWRNSTVFNCTVTFEISDGMLMRVMGRRPAVVSDSAVSANLDLSAALLAFLRYDIANETGCTEISSVQPGYRWSAGGIGDGELTPGWLFVTDCGDFFADAVTGNVTRNDA